MLSKFTVQIDGQNLEYVNTGESQFRLASGTLSGGTNANLDIVANTIETVIADLASVDCLNGTAALAVQKTWEVSKQALSPAIA